MTTRFQQAFRGRSVRHGAAVLILLALGCPTLGKESDRLEGERFPMTRSREIKSEEKWKPESADYALQELYARHGYDFPDPAVRQMFEKLKWYRERLRPGVEALAIQSDFSDLEYSNEKMLYVIRSEIPAVRKVRAAESLPRLRADLFISYEYGDIPKPAEGAEEGWEAYYRSKTSGLERRRLGVSHPVNDATGTAQVIEEKIPDSPWKLVVRWGPQKGKPPGTPASLTCEVTDLRSGEKLAGVEDGEEPAVPSVDRLRAEDFVSVFSFDEKQNAFAEFVQKWIERDEGKKAREVSVSGMSIQIGLESVPMQQSAPGTQPPKPAPPQG